MRYHRISAAPIALLLLTGATLGGCARGEAPPVASAAVVAPAPVSLAPTAPPATPATGTVVYADTGGVPAGPAKTQALDIVGRWGFASYHKFEDRDRTIAAAVRTCTQPYLIGEGAHGGVVMHLADQREPQELAIKGSTDGYDYIGPEGPAGGEKDRKIVSFDGKLLTLEYVSQEVTSRYGTSVFVRCGSTVEPEAPDTMAEPQKRIKARKKTA